LITAANTGSRRRSRPRGLETRQRLLDESNQMGWLQRFFNVVLPFDGGRREVKDVSQ